MALKETKNLKVPKTFIKKAQGIVILISIFLITCLVTACQPTPDTAPVVNKLEGLPKTNSSQNVQSEKNIEATDHWVQTIQKLDGQFIIEADADVYIPEHSAIPIYLIEQAQLSQEKATQLINYFSDGKKLYESDNLTKADLEQQLVQAKRGELIEGEYVVTDQSKQLVKELEEKIQNATNSRVYTDSVFTYRRDPLNNNQPVVADGENYLDLRVEDGDGKDAWINASRSGYFGYYKYGYAYTESDLSDPNILKAILASYENGITTAIGSTDNESLTEDETKKLGAIKKLMTDIQLTPEAAQAKGQKVLDDLGLTGYILASCEKAVINTSIDNTAEKVGGYELEYTRSLGGLPGYLLRGGKILQGNEKDGVPQYVPPFYMESIVITIPEDGSIGSFQWMDQAKIKETVLDDAQLMPFGEISELAANQLYYNDSFLLSGEGNVVQQVRVEVLSAKLLCAYVNAKDQPEKAWMIPAWHFKANIYQTVDGKESLYKQEDMLLNALDGGIIEAVQPSN